MDEGVEECRLCLASDNNSFRREYFRFACTVGLAARDRVLRRLHARNCFVHSMVAAVCLDIAIVM